MPGPANGAKPLVAAEEASLARPLLDGEPGGSGGEPQAAVDRPVGSPRGGGDGEAPGESGGATTATWCTGTPGTFRHSGTAAVEVLARSEWKRFQESHCGGYDRLFKKHLNPRFAREAEAALRCALCVVVIAVPIMNDDTGIEAIRWLKRHGLYTQSSATYFVFFVWSNFGDMMELVQTGVLGLVLAIAWQCLMASMLPTGLSGDDSQATFRAVVLSGVLFVWLISWLNFSRLTAITAIQTFVWFWMEFLDPSQVPRTTLQAMNELFAAAVAFAGCLAALLLPSPLFSISQAQDSARRLTRCLSLTWVDFIDCYCDAEPDSFCQQRGARNLRGLHRQIGELEEQLHSAWWESVASKNIHRRRRMLRRLDVFLREAFDRVRGAQNACRWAGSDRALGEEASGSFSVVLARAEDSLRGVVTEAGSLLAFCIEATSSGATGPKLREELAMQANTVRGHVAAASETFFAVRSEAGTTAFSLEMKCVHSFCLELCAYGRLAAEFAEDLLLDASGERPLPVVKETPWFGEIFDCRVIFSSEQTLSALRHTAKILLAFLFGYGGVRHIDMSYDPGVANVMGVMLNRAALGSELEKNLARMQGAVIGTIVGDLAVALFIGCDYLDQFGKHMLLFIVAAGSFFLYFHATRYADSYLGFILIFFTCKALIKSCDTPNFSYELFYNDVVDIVVALFILVAVDMLSDVLSNRRPSRLACKAYGQGWGAMCESLARLLASGTPGSPKEGTAQPFVEKARKHFAAAASLNVEAAKEPRLWRAAWPEGLFSSALGHADRTLLALSRLRYTATSQVDGGEETSAFFFGLLQAPTFQKVGGILLREMCAVEDKLVKMLEHELEDPPDALQHSGLWDDPRAAWSAAVRELVQEVSKLQQVPTVRYCSLEEDPVAQVCLIIDSMEEMMTEVQRLFEATLQAL